MAPSKSLSWTIALLLLPSHISSQGFCGLLYLTNSCLYRIQNLGLKEELGGSQIMRVETEIKFWVCYSSQHKLYWHDYHLNIFKIISVCNSIQAQLISLAHLLSEHRCTLGKEGWENTTCFQCLRYPLCWIGPIAWDATLAWGPASWWFSTWGGSASLSWRVLVSLGRSPWEGEAFLSHGMV